MYYKNKDLALYYKMYGTGCNNIIILPGWGDTRKTFNEFINHYQEDYKIYILDYPGFGKSTFPERDLTIFNYAKLIRDFMDDLKISNPIIIAHSFGGRIATLLVTKYNVKVSKMVFMNVAGIRRKSFKRWFRQIIYKIRKKLSIFIPHKRRNSYLKRLRNKYGSEDYNNLSTNMVKTFSNIVNEDLRQYIPQIRNDVLLIWGMMDEATPLKDGYYFQRRIKDSAIIVFPKGTHFTYLEYPQLVISIIDKFLEG